MRGKGAALRCFEYGEGVIAEPQRELDIASPDWEGDVYVHNPEVGSRHYVTGPEVKGTLRIRVDVVHLGTCSVQKRSKRSL